MMKRFATATDFYLGLVTVFLLLQAQLNMELDVGKLGWLPVLQFAVSVLDVVTVLTGWLLRFGNGGPRRGGGWSAWHGTVMLLVAARIAFAFALHRVSLGHDTIASHLWILAGVAVGVPTIVHWRRLPAAGAAVRASGPLPTPAPAAIDPALLGKYERRGLLGRGAMGSVYEGFDPVLGRRVAIKVVPRPADTDRQAVDAFARFRREAQAVGRLHHPNIVAVHDFGETAECAYLVMELIDGGSVAALLEAGPPPVSETLRLMQGVLAGLQHSHECGIIHRDIKPANIMLGRDGVPKITDFGVARTIASELTAAGDVVGTASCMAPEQFLGEAVDARTDIYAAGILFYRLLTGRRPFDGSMAGVMNQVLTSPPPAPSASRGGLSACFDPVVCRAMARLPEDRFASASAFAAVIREAGAPRAAEAEATQVVIRSAA